MGTAAAASAPGSASQPWEALPDSIRRIYLALAGGDEERARQLLEADRQAATTRRRRPQPRPQRPRRHRTDLRPSAESAADPGSARDGKTNSRHARAKGNGGRLGKAKAATGTGRGAAGEGSATRITSTLGLRGFVERHEGHFEPLEMRAAEVWKRHMARS
jgi:hypothetical protein